MKKESYNQAELQEFRSVITAKLEKAKEQCAYLKATVNKSESNGTDDTSWSTKMLEDGAETLSREEMNILYQKQLTTVRELEMAIERINNKTYGICMNTGELIPKERLNAMPNATSIILK